MYMYMYICICICIYMYMYMYICICICKCICICIYVYVYVYICICICIYVYVYVYMYMYICICIYVYVYVYIYVICFGFNGIIVIVFDIYWGQNKLAILWYVDICGCVWKWFYTLQVVTWFVPKVRKIQLVDGQWLEFQFRSYIEFVAPTKTSANLQPSSIFTWMTYVVVFFHINIHFGDGSKTINFRGMNILIAIRNWPSWIYHHLPSLNEHPCTIHLPTPLTGISIIYHLPSNLSSYYQHIYICICIYVYMYISIYVYMYICIYVYMYICIYVYVYVYMYICICVYVYMYMCICICVYVYMYMCLCICICLYVYVYMCICICICVYVYVYVYMYMYMCICICVYVYVYVYMYMCICICICVYVYVYMYMYIYVFFPPVLYPYPAIAKSGSASSPEPWLSATPLRRRRPFSSRWDARWDARRGQEGLVLAMKNDEKWAVNGISWPKLIKTLGILMIFDDFWWAKRLSVGSLETILITKELRSVGIWWMSGYKWI